MATFQRPLFSEIRRRLLEPRRFMQVLHGPRQVGKTTLVRQVAASLSLPQHYASADEPTLRERSWIAQQWDLGRLRAREGGPGGGLLVLDEVQKVPAWSEVVKRLWDEDTLAGLELRVVLLGSSALLMSRGLGESLAGRFESVPVPHWSYAEMAAAFGFSMEQFVYFGGYPGAASLCAEPVRWANYIRDALIETTLARDILLVTRVDKPALLRRLFHLGCEYSGQVLSYQKMLGSLQDAGNTTTLAHYLELMSGAGLLTGLSKFSGQRLQQRASSPKLQVLNTALISAQQPLSPGQAREDGDVWGRLVESAVGAHLLNGSVGTRIEVCYWREGNKEVDYVLRDGDGVVALEVKSGQRKANVPGLDAFDKAYRPRRRLLVGGQGVPLEEFLRTSPAHWF